MSEHAFVPCSLCGRRVRLQPWALIWGRPICRECRDYHPDEPGMFEEGPSNEDEGGG